MEALFLLWAASVAVGQVPVLEPLLLERRAACQKGDLAACAYEATAWEWGWHGLEADPARAAGLYADLCGRKHAPACDVLGLLRLRGRGVDKDETAAASLFERACEEGVLSACRNLAQALESGSGVPRDETRALALWDRACRTGDPRDCEQVARRLATGLGLAKNEGRALAFAEVGCDRKVFESCALSADLILRGAPGPDDRRRAAVFLASACESWIDDACMDLGRVLETEPDGRARAQAAYEKACEHSYRPACRAAARLRGEASPVPDDPDLLNTQRLVIHPSLPPFEFRLHGSDYGEVYRIAVSTPGAPGADLNWIPGERPDGQSFRGAPTPALADVDLNFDGYQDLTLMTWAGATGNKGGVVWIFDPQTRTFVPHPELSEESNLRPHPDRQVLTTFATGGHAGSICNSRTFRWSEGRAVLVREVAQTWVEERRAYVKAVSELVHGQLQVVKTVERRLDGAKDDKDPSRPCEWTP